MTILVHLNVEKEPADERTADEIADAILDVLGRDFTLPSHRLYGLTIVCPMAEEVEV